MPGSFIDTNVLLYIASSDPVKAAKAEEIIAAGGSISVQVLNELTNMARRKMHMSSTETHNFLNMLRSLLTVHPLRVETHETGLALAERYGFSTYDAMIVSAAAHAACDTLWSEDMHDGLVVEGRLRILNPFQFMQNATHQTHLATAPMAQSDHNATAADNVQFQVLP